MMLFRHWSTLFCHWSNLADARFQKRVEF